MLPIGNDNSRVSMSFQRPLCAKLLKQHHKPCCRIHIVLQALARLILFIVFSTFRHPSLSSSIGVSSVKCLVSLRTLYGVIFFFTCSKKSRRGDKRGGQTLLYPCMLVY